MGIKSLIKKTTGGDSANFSDISSKYVKSFDFAGAMGAGAGLGLGKQDLSLQGRFTQGFTNIIKDAMVKNQNFSVMAGISF